MRILWLSRVPWSVGGYSNQTAAFTPRLAAAGHEVGIISAEGSTQGMQQWRGLPVYPMLLNDLRRTSLVGLHYQDFDADLLIGLHDAGRVLDGPSLLKRFPKVEWALWFPIDGPEIQAKALRHLKSVSYPLSISRYGERIAGEHGIEARYIPHGVATGVFQPLPRAEARRRVGWSPDLFVAGMVAANDGTRKAFPQHIEGFALFHREHPDSFLYLHTEEVAIRGLDLSSLCTRLDLRIGKDVVFCDPYEYFLGKTEAQMAELYSAMDVHMLITKGEGFGLPILEAQSCGTPVIVGDWSAMAELCFAGWKVGLDESREVEWKWRTADPAAIADRLAEAYRASRDPERAGELRHRARAGAMEYDADKVVADYWVPVLDDIANRQAASAAPSRATALVEGR